MGDDRAPDQREEVLALDGLCLTFSLLLATPSPYIFFFALASLPSCAQVVILIWTFTDPKDIEHDVLLTLDCFAVALLVSHKSVSVSYSVPSVGTSPRSCLLVVGVNLLSVRIRSHAMLLCASLLLSALFSAAAAPYILCSHLSCLVFLGNYRV